jgi:hypothetical protein
MERPGPALAILAAEGLRQPDATEVQPSKAWPGRHPGPVHRVRISRVEGKVAVADGRSPGLTS